MPRKMAREPSTVPGGKSRSTQGTSTKISLVLDLLHRNEGASLDEMVQATGWLPHTTRAALTGLKKKGHVVTREKVDGVTRYTIAPVTAE
jgi:hypothetical protein